MPFKLYGILSKQTFLLYRIKNVEYIKFNDIGMRVALLANVINPDTDQEVIAFIFLLATLHFGLSI